MLRNFELLTMMLVLATLAVVSALIFSPSVGLVAYLRKRRVILRRQHAEDALKHLLKEEYAGRHGSFSSLAGMLRLSDESLMELVGRLQRQGLIQTQGAQFHLKPEGKRVALHVIRAHRLWERYLADEARLPLLKLHEEAERLEHSLTPKQVDRLDALLGHPPQDPHGDPIPTSDGYLEPPSGLPMTDWPIGKPGRIVHLEDEPPLAYSQIVTGGFCIGQVIWVREVTPEKILFGDNKREYWLAPAVAANIFLTDIRSSPALESGVVSLSSLKLGVAGEVVRLDDACRGFTRRRLLDLGFTVGATVRLELSTFVRDPCAYRIRGTLIALRRDQAAQIFVRPDSVEKKEKPDAVGSLMEAR